MARNVKTASSKDFPLSGGSDAPFLFVDGYQGVMIANGVVRLRLVRGRQTDSADDTEIENEVVARLAMGAATLESFYKALGGLVKDMKEDGTLPPSESEDKS